MSETSTNTAHPAGNRDEDDRADLPMTQEHPWEGIGVGDGPLFQPRPPAPPGVEHRPE